MIILKSFKRELVINSIYISGEKDAVRCFHCDGSLCNWDHAQDPFTEHARWYPNCAFIKSIKGSVLTNYMADINYSESYKLNTKFKEINLYHLFCRK